MFYTVFSTNTWPKMQWQSDLLEYSWKRVGQEGVLIRLVATDDPQNLPTQKYARCIATQLMDTHPETEDLYPIYNKPASLLEWVFRDRPEGTVLLLDPDCVFRKPVTQRVAPGFPASQAWIRFQTRKPTAKNPFGFGAGFSFLKDHCARRDLSIEPVMIPTLIHTSDLRKICARWLELTGIIRQHDPHGDGLPMRESDMFAYMVASAEYGLRHDPISLGVCTNWQAADAPDAPIIHYCAPFSGKDGKELFAKAEYIPWTRVDTSIEPPHDFGRDLVALVNDYIDDTNGVTRQPAHYGRPKWHDNVMEGRVIDELLLELPAEQKSLWLNATGKAIWERCDGSSTIDEIGTEMCNSFDGSGSDVTADVVSTISHLYTVGFLEFR